RPSPRTAAPGWLAGPDGAVPPPEGFAVSESSSSLGVFRALPARRSVETFASMKAAWTTFAEASHRCASRAQGGAGARGFRRRCGKRGDESAHHDGPTKDFFHIGAGFYMLRRRGPAAT